MPDLLKRTRPLHACKNSLMWDKVNAGMQNRHVGPENVTECMLELQNACKTKMQTMPERAKNRIVASS